ncbi:hypothetical protein F511_07259 [Dorcoceras hygrometricum]|uniref:Auxilin-related protein 2-like n=1 Tax=Dorcoceras hygrometricum TaxID=472368 RepID=A0A2Z7AU47_9LAMI|nr:hypothetical protein F511_07259 [Dorcoceras hygrometricum]
MVEFSAVEVDMSYSSSGGQGQQSEEIWLTASEIPLYREPTNAPPPSRPPPPIPRHGTRSETNYFPQVQTRRMVNFFQLQVTVSLLRVPSSLHLLPTVKQSQFDELEDFAKGFSRYSVHESTHLHSNEEANAKRLRRKARKAVERARVRASAAEARERAERAATEARERAAAAQAREKEEANKAAAEARERAAAAQAREKEEANKAAAAKVEAEARRRAERAAFERAAAEAQERAAADARKRAAAAAKANQRKNDNDLDSIFGVGRANSAPRARENSTDSMFNQQFPNKGASEDAKKTSSGISSNMKRPSSTTNIIDDLSSIFGEFQKVEGETEERRRARLERIQRTQERAAKALAEKNKRDIQAKRDQEERHRISETLDIEIKRWAAGKEGNVRALLSTLQYVRYFLLYVQNLTLSCCTHSNLALVLTDVCIIFSLILILGMTAIKKNKKNPLGSY